MIINIKSVIRKVLISLLTVFCLYGTYNLYNMVTTKDVYNTRYVSGTITDKFESAYSCGKRSVCYVRYLKVGDTTESVTLDTYVKAREGSNISLVIKERQPRNQSSLELLSSFAGLCFIACLILFGSWKLIDWLIED